MRNEICNYNRPSHVSCVSIARLCRKFERNMAKPYLKLGVLCVSFWRLDLYRHTSNIRRIMVGIKIADHSDVIGASSVGAAPTTSSFST